MLHYKLDMGDEILKQLSVRLETALSSIKKDLSTVRTGRAKSSMVEEVRVEAYGAIMTLKELASVAVPDPTLIVISPWDKSLVANILTGVQKAELNLQVVADGETIKISVPPLSQERRQELVKLVHTKLEAGKVMIRNIRTDTKAEIEALEGQGGVSEDDIKVWLARMQTEIDRYSTLAEQVGRDKETELTTL